MSVNNGEIIAPVSIDDVKSVLGESSNDLATLCKSANINMFSRYKPVSYPKLFDVTDAERKSIGHGISPASKASTSLSGALIKEVAQLNWSYTKPSGGSSSPYRLGDFKGYYHDAVPVVQCVYDGGFSHAISNSNTFKIHFDIDPGESTYNLQGYDLTAGNINLKEYRFTAYIEYTNGQSKGIYQSNYILDSSGNIQGDVINVNVSGWSSAVYYVYICMVKVSDGAYTYIPLPKAGDYNPWKMLLSIDASAGLIIVSNNSQTSFAPSYNGVYHTYDSVMDEGTSQYAMSNYDGQLLVHIKVKNKSSSSKTYNRSDFKMIYPKGAVPDAMFTSKPSGAGGIKQVTFAGNETKDLWFEFSSLLSSITSTDKYNTVEIELQVSGIQLFNGSLYYHRGVPGWTKI